jgi:DNA-binding response OmpR family regulator
MKKTILVVEDNQDLNSFIQIRLKSQGYDVESCFDGASAFEKIIEKKPDLVILDLDIPEMYGFELLGRVRNMKGLDKTKFMILTGAPDKVGDKTADEQWKNMTGVEAFVSKPFISEDFLSKIKEILNS